MEEYFLYKREIVLSPKSTYTKSWSLEKGLCFLGNIF